MQGPLGDSYRQPSHPLPFAVIPLCLSCVLCTFPKRVRPGRKTQMNGWEFPVWGWIVSSWEPWSVCVCVYIHMPCCSCVLGLKKRSRARMPFPRWPQTLAARPTQDLINLTKLAGSAGTSEPRRIPEQGTCGKRCLSLTFKGSFVPRGKNRIISNEHLAI